MALLSESDPLRIKIFINNFLTEEEEIEVPRTFRERWVSIPFRPWVKTKKVIRRVPSRKIYQTQFGLFMHPELAKELQERFPSK